MLVGLVAGACIVRTRPPARGRPVYVQPEKHKHKKHKKHDNGRGNAYGRDKNR